MSLPVFFFEIFWSPSRFLLSAFAFAFALVPEGRPTQPRRSTSVRLEKRFQWTYFNGKVSLNLETVSDNPVVVTFAGERTAWQNLSYALLTFLMA